MVRSLIILITAIIAGCSGNSDLYGTWTDGQISILFEKDKYKMSGGYKELICVHSGYQRESTPVTLMLKEIMKGKYGIANPPDNMTFFQFKCDDANDALVFAFKPGAILIDKDNLIFNESLWHKSK